MGSIAISVRRGDNRTVSEPAAAAIFARGAVVLVTLNSPREKFWGAVLELTTAGLGVRGMDLNSLDDFARLVREGEPVAANSVFFPMHRIERIELDAPNGNIPSLAERFASKSGRDPAETLGVTAERQR
jgi:hypothetical protein